MDRLFNRVGSLFLGLLCAASVCVDSRAVARSNAAKQPVTTTAGSLTVTADFGAPVSYPPLTGFLHGLDSWQGVPNSALTPLKPVWWRIAANDMPLYQRAASLSPNVEIVVSDAYGYPMNNWLNNGPPWQNNWQNWQNYVTAQAAMYKGTNVYWDIWNEPDAVDWNVTTFWSGTQAQYFETYKRAYTILRQQLGSTAMIGGPSYANYVPNDIAAFLKYCNDNKLQVNFLSWHELMDADPDIPSIATHIAAMRSLAAQYPNLKVQKIIINESVGPDTQYEPGDILAYLYYLQTAGADGANKACWNASDGSNNCFNASVDGIIAPGSFQPRAAWWAYKTYSDGVGSAVKITLQGPGVVAFASKKPAQVLLGHFGQSGSLTVNPTVYLEHLTALGVNGKTVQVTITKVPNNGEQTVSAPTPVSVQQVPVVNGTAAVYVPNVKLHEEYILSIGS